jgi:basic membrane protein A
MFSYYLIRRNIAMFKKILSLCLVVVMIAALGVSMVSCGGGADDDFKLGVILLHDEASTYDLNFIEAVERAAEQLGLSEDQVIYKKNIPESAACTEAADDLVDQGCKIVFANSFGHESFLLNSAKKHPEVQFCHATGTKAHTEDTPNFHNAFASIYEGRFLAGVAAGLKLNEMIADGKINGDAPKMGYVGAFTYAEVISGYTSFFLGAKSVCPTVTMEVQFTGSWYDEIKEKEAATALINNGCDLISQHADSMGAPSICEERGVPNVSYNGATDESCPGTFIVSSRIDWAPYYLYIIKQFCTGAEIADDWCGGVEEGSVVLTGVNKTAAADGTFEKIQEVAAKLKDGTIKVFDVNTFTVNNGQKIADDHLADVDDFGDYAPETDVVDGGEFQESLYRSAPYFDLRIDGIKLLNEKF